MHKPMLLVGTDDQSCITAFVAVIIVLCVDIPWLHKSDGGIHI